MDRAEQLESIVSQIVDEFNDMISDEALDFDLHSACAVAGELFSRIILSANVDDEVKEQMTAEWLEMHNERITQRKPH